VEAVPGEGAGRGGGTTYTGFANPVCEIPEKVYVSGRDRNHGKGGQEGCCVPVEVSRETIASCKVWPGEVPCTFVKSPMPACALSVGVLLNWRVEVSIHS